MNCLECKNALAAYLDTLLDAAEESRIETHLTNCSTCQAELDATRRIYHRLLLDGQRASKVSIEDSVMNHVRHGTVTRSGESSTGGTRRIVILAAAAMILAAIGMAFSRSLDDGSVAYAQEIASARRQLQQARTIKWLQTSLHKSRQKDGSAAWIDGGTRRWLYKDPGLVRIEHLDRDQQPTRIEIINHLQAKRLAVDLGTKQATLYTLERPTEGPVDWSPLGWAVAELRGNLEFLGDQTIGGRLANGFRTANANSAFGEVSYNADFWIDEETKRLVMVQRPGGDRMEELKNDPQSLMPGQRDHAIEFGLDLDDRLFHLEPPEGFKIEVIAPPEISEQEMIDWLALAAKLNNDVFPDDVVPTAIDSNVMHEIINHKSPQDLPSLKKMVRDRYDLHDRVHFRPITRFVEHTAKESWVYLGKGVPLGNQERIVCFYKKDDSSGYRVVYGDLSVKDATPAELPLPVE